MENELIFETGYGEITFYGIDDEKEMGILVVDRDDNGLQTYLRKEELILLKRHIDRLLKELN